MRQTRLARVRCADPRVSSGAAREGARHGSADGASGAAHEGALHGSADGASDAAREGARHESPDGASGAREGATSAEGRIDAIGSALTDIAAATVQGALEAVLAFRPDRDAPLMRFAVIAHGPLRRSGARLRLRRRRAVRLRAAAGRGRAGGRVRAFAVATELRSLLQTPSTDPPLQIDADLRPEGRQGPLVRTLASYDRVLPALVQRLGGAGAAARGTRSRATPTSERGSSRRRPAALPGVRARPRPRCARSAAQGADGGRAAAARRGPRAAHQARSRRPVRHRMDRPAPAIAARRRRSPTCAGPAPARPSPRPPRQGCSTPRTRHCSTRPGRTPPCCATESRSCADVPGDQVPTDARELAGIAHYLGEDVDSETLLDNHRRRARRARASLRARSSTTRSEELQVPAAPTARGSLRAALLRRGVKSHAGRA